MPEFRVIRELSAKEQYKFDLARAQLKAASNTSALLAGSTLGTHIFELFQKSRINPAGFAMVCLVELQIAEPGTNPHHRLPEGLIILLAVGDSSWREEGTEFRWRDGMREGKTEKVLTIRL